MPSSRAVCLNTMPGAGGYALCPGLGAGPRVPCTWECLHLPGSPVLFPELRGISLALPGPSGLLGVFPLIARAARAPPGLREVPEPLPDLLLALRSVARVPGAACRRHPVSRVEPCGVPGDPSGVRQGPSSVFWSAPEPCTCPLMPSGPLSSHSGLPPSPLRAFRCAPWPRVCFAARRRGLCLAFSPVLEFSGCFWVCPRALLLVPPESLCLLYRCSFFFFFS